MRCTHTVVRRERQCRDTRAGMLARAVMHEGAAGGGPKVLLPSKYPVLTKRLRHGVTGTNSCTNHGSAGRAAAARC